MTKPKQAPTPHAEKMPNNASEGGGKRRLEDQWAYEKGLKGPAGIREGADIEVAILGRMKQEAMQEWGRFWSLVREIASHPEWQPLLQERSRYVQFITNNVKRALQKLGMVDEPIKFYTTLGSALDTYHGVDAIISWGNPAETGVIVSIDVTSNPNKTHAKSDVVIQARMTQKGEVVIDPGELDRVVKRITELLSQRNQQAIQRKKSQQQRSRRTVFRRRDYSSNRGTNYYRVDQ